MATTVCALEIGAIVAERFPWHKIRRDNYLDGGRGNRAPENREPVTN